MNWLRILLVVLISVLYLGVPMTSGQETTSICSEGWKEIAGGCYIIARNNDLVLIIQLRDQIVADKSQTLSWKRGGFKRGQRPEVEKLATKLTDIPGVVDVLAESYTLQIIRVELFYWNEDSSPNARPPYLLPKIRAVLEASEVVTTPND
jgi:hypothetical protein